MGVILSSSKRRKRRKKRRLEVIPWAGEGQPYRINGGRCTLSPSRPLPGRAPEASPWFVYILWKFCPHANGGGRITWIVLVLSKKRCDFMLLFIYFWGNVSTRLRCKMLQSSHSARPFFTVFSKGFLSHHLTLRGLVGASLDNRSSLSPARSYQVRSGVREMPTRTALG